jgi:hypothetical protein
VLKLERLILRGLKAQLLTATLKPWLSEEQLEVFLCGMIEKRVKVDWSLPLHLLSWISARSVVSAEFAQHLLRTACTRWSLQGFEHIDAQGLLLASPFVSGYFVGIEKSMRFAHSAKHIMIADPTQKTVQSTYYALVYPRGLRGLVWQELKI